MPRRVERENKRKRIELSQKLAARREKDDDAALSLKEETLLEAEERERRERREEREGGKGRCPRRGGARPFLPFFLFRPLLSLAHISTRERKTLSSSRQLFRHDLLKPLLFPEQLGR